MNLKYQKKIISFFLGGTVFLAANISFASTTLLDGLPGATTYGDLAMTRNDDGSSNLLNLPFGIDFFGNNYNTFYINNNGNVTFEGSLSGYTPNPFPITNLPMIAPFWGDVDTRGGNVDMNGLGNNVYVSAPNLDTAVVTWNNVGYYGAHTDKLNNFQLVLRNRADTGAGNFDIEFRYEQLEWTTGDASGGSAGFGGTPAQAGFDAGDGTNFYTLPGSRTAGVLDLVNTSNVSEATPGLWSFAVRNGQLPGGTSDNPIMPVIVEENFNFDFNINLVNQQIFIDPIVAIGYDYVVDSGSPNFASVLLPTGFGDNLYDLYLWNGTSWVLDSSGIAGGVSHSFSTSVNQFRILGIETSEGLDPLDPTAFVTGLTFDGIGAVSMHMSPITFDTGSSSSVPEPGTFLLLGSGLVGLIGIGKRRKNI